MVPHTALLCVAAAGAAHCLFLAACVQKNRDAGLSASLLDKTTFAIGRLPADVGVIREMQIVGAGPIKVNPALNRIG
jgi:hypothetical protein